MQQINGNIFCPLDDDWINYKERLKGLANKVEQMHTTSEVLKTQIGHLEKLDKLEAIADSITLMKDRLLDRAISFDNRATKTLSWVIFGLVAVIVFLLTGEVQGWIGGLHK